MSFESLKFELKPIDDALNKKGVTEICICGEYSVFIEDGNTWEYREVETFTEKKLLNIARLIASLTDQSISKEHPILSAFLPTGERVQIVIPPAASEISITIRRPSDVVYSLDDFAKMGTFSQAVITVVEKQGEITDSDKKLLSLLESRKFRDFFSLIVKKRKNILVSGATGSGKTTFMKGLVLEIPSKERIITIEDVPELILPHKNSVRLIYSKDNQGNSDVTPKKLLESCLRMRPDRILLAELRGEEAFYFVRNVNSGHPGSITSIHAGSCEMAFDQLMLYIKESEAGNNLDRKDILTLLHNLVDVVVQYKQDENGNRIVSEIYFDPREKLNLSKGFHLVNR